MATVRIPVAGLSRLASALTGGGDAYQDAFNREAAFQSKIGQALATARKSNAEADIAEQVIAARTPDAIRSNAMTTLGIPSAALPEVEDFQRDGYIGRYQLPDAQAGPTEPAPAWTKNLGNLGRAIGATQSAIALGDKSVKNLVDAQGMLNDQDLQGRIIAGVESPLAVAQAKYALKGSAPYDFNEYGVGNNLTGELDTDNPAARRLGAVRESDAARNRAAATASYASAENSRASAANTRSKIGATQTTVLPDGTTISTGRSAPKLTELQGKATLFGSRAAEADNLLREMEGGEQGGLQYSPELLSSKLAAESTPLIGGALGMVGNFAIGSNEQKVEQAQRDFINAILRLESGAVISPEEFDNARKQYFPRPGDTRKTILQKQRNRETAINGLRTMAGPAAESVQPRQVSRGGWSITKE